jgi:FMN phosphatase YigB (HAD superfamily)
MVGDSLERDVHQALKVGIKAFGSIPMAVILRLGFWLSIN